MRRQGSVVADCELTPTQRQAKEEIFNTRWDAFTFRSFKLGSRTVNIRLRPGPVLPRGGLV